MPIHEWGGSQVVRYQNGVLSDELVHCSMGSHNGCSHRNLTDLLRQREHHLGMHCSVVEHLNRIRIRYKANLIYIK